MRRLSAPASVMGECAYAPLAISFSAFVVAPVAFAVSGFPVPPLFSIPAEIDLAPNQPVSRVSANSCCFLSQALDALAV